MTEITIITSNLKKAENILFKLENENLIINGFITKEHSLRIPAKYKITAQTRVILFEKIHDSIRLNFKNDPITIYSTPIVNMQWEKANSLLQNSKSA